MITFLTPGMLALLAALGIPLLIHLRQRDRARPIPFAALRWLHAAEQQRRRRRWRDLPLLLVRLAVLTMFALFLAAPHWNGTRFTPARVAVIPGADWQRFRARWPDAQWHWLAPGWPALDSKPPAQVATASLLRQLDRELPPGVPLHVLAPSEVDGLDGGAIVLTRTVDWQPSGDRLQPTPATPNSPPLRLALRAEAKQTHTARLLVQALVANGMLATAAEADFGSETEPIAETTDILIWLADTAPPPAVHAWLHRGGKLLRVCAEADCPALPDPASRQPLRLWSSRRGPAFLQASAHGSGQLLDLHARLQAQALPEWVEPDFPALLRVWLQAIDPEPTRAPATAVAPIRGGSPWPVSPLDLRPVTLVLLFVLLLAERWLVWRQLRGAAP